MCQVTVFAQWKDSGSELCDGRDAPLSLVFFLGHTNIRCPLSFLRARRCMRGGGDYFYLIIINASYRNTERFPPVARENCCIASPQFLAFWCLLVHIHLTSLFLYLFNVKSHCCRSLCVFQCMRNPALLQRTGLVIRVLCHIQENVWLLRWMCRCWRHHGQLLGGTDNTVISVLTWAKTGALIILCVLY